MKKLYLLDRHITLTGDADFRLNAYGHRVINCSLSDHWRLRYPSDPARNLTYLEKQDIPVAYDGKIYDRLARKFQLEEERHQPDYFYCGFPPSLFTLFSKCAAPVILNLLFRFEGHCKIQKEDFDKLIETAMRRINDKQLYVYAASHYDRAYFKYFTGMEIPTLPVTCRYLRHLQWDINKVRTDEFLIFNGRFGQYPDHQKIIDQYVQWFAEHTDIKLTTALPRASFLQNLLSRETVRDAVSKMLRKHRYTFRLRDIGYTQSSLLHYKALVCFPYSVYSGTMLEYLSMGIPLFFPSQKLMKQLHRQFNILPERTSVPRGRYRGEFSTLAYGKHLMPDPNDDIDPDAAHYWLDRCEWFRWQVRYFDSPQDLYEKLKDADFPRLHDDIQKTWRELDTQSEQQWTELLT